MKIELLLDALGAILDKKVSNKKTFDGEVLNFEKESLSLKIYAKL